MTVEELVAELCKLPYTAEVEIRPVYSADVYLIDDIKVTINGVVRIVVARFPVDPNLAGLDLSKREFFAAAALQGLLANPNKAGVFTWQAGDAVKYADALIEALNANTITITEGTKKAEALNANKNADTPEASAENRPSTQSCSN